MELRRFKYMAVLAEELHFGRAAERLGIAQPSTHPADSGARTRTRRAIVPATKRSVRLTVAGRVTLDEAIRTLQQADRTALVAKQARRGQLGHIEIGFVGSAVFSGVLSKVTAPDRSPRTASLRTHPRDCQDVVKDENLHLAALQQPLI
jgi:DNA-binding transcriptional LysR family regulator